MTHEIAVLGIFAADAAFRSARLPQRGETILGDSFALSPGGKGSNQAIAAARAGAKVAMLTRIGTDSFGDMALSTWAQAGVSFKGTQTPDHPTGAAFIHVDSATGDNAIIVAPGAAGQISPADIDDWSKTIRAAKIFMCQLEQPLDAACHALEIARSAGVTTILNPAPAASLPPDMLSFCDFVTPNETEAESLTGCPVTTVEEAEFAARELIRLGAGAAIITLGDRGALYSSGNSQVYVSALTAGPVVETTGAGDAFNGGLATALAEGRNISEALRFANATAAISVTRSGAASSMPDRYETDSLLASPKSN
ncbi:ribokinase [Palleronia caenipelagi]|uniref:Ribokinase n=1 Tax=Palleronia caenipelagi TaxID=2489174 RepID=A0A547Q8B6_9RHOB|nr:ribokinase [Palleronia caenipelagi]TRD22620.1 ribokinase [Palleronia caenipelagi]